MIIAWHKESRRHSLAARGVKTKQDPVIRAIGNTPTTIMSVPAVTVLELNKIQASLPQGLGEKFFQLLTLQPYSLHIKTNDKYIWIKNIDNNKIVKLRKGEDFDKDGVVNELDINPFKKGE